MNLRKNIYSFLFFLFFLFLIIDELSFILYNISLYQIFCGSNFIKLYESFFKLPINHIFTLNIHCSSSYVTNFFLVEENINYFFHTDKNFLLVENNNLKIDVLNSKSLNLSSNDNIYLIHFDTLTTQKQKINFDVLQSKIYVCPGETNLAFFRINNLTTEVLNAFSVYVVSPTDYTPFINKLQCFCYEELLLYPNETVDLPVLFRIEQDVLKLENLSKEIVIEYIIVL